MCVPDLKKYHIRLGMFLGHGSVLV